jgi:hypothetical protein
MIIKKMDSKQEEIAELTALLKGKLIPYQWSLIERGLKAIRSGVSGEKKRTRCQVPKGCCSKLVFDHE